MTPRGRFRGLHLYSIETHRHLKHLTICVSEGSVSIDVPRSSE
jgi:hypothetical protein